MSGNFKILSKIRENEKIWKKSGNFVCVIFIFHVSFSGLPSVRVPSVSVEPLSTHGLLLTMGTSKRFNIHSLAILGGRGS